MIPIAVEVAYLNNAWTTSPTWSLLPSADVERVIIRRGKPTRGKTADIGRATITLINRIGDYEPQGERGKSGNPGFAFYSHPGKRIRIVYVSTPNVVLFDGLISAVRHQIDEHPERVIYECVDRMQLLRLRDYDYLATTSAENTAFNNAVAALNFPSFFSSSGVLWRSVALPTERRSVYDRIAQMTDITGAAFYVSRTGIVTYKSYEHRYALPVATLTNDPLVDVWIVGQSRVGLNTWLSETNPRTLGTRLRYDEISEILLDAADVYNSVSVRKPPAAWSTYGSNESQTLYDVRRFSLESDLFATNTDAQTYGQYLVSEYALPEPTPDYVIIRQPQTITALTTLDLFDVLLVEYTARTASIPNRTRYDRTRRLYCLVSALEYNLGGKESQLTIGLEPVRWLLPFRASDPTLALLPLSAGEPAPDGALGGKVFI